MEGEPLTLDAPQTTARRYPPGNLPPPSRRAMPSEELQAKGPVPGRHSRAPTPKARRQRSPAACSKDRQPAEGGRLTRDAPDEGTRHPPWGWPPANPIARNAQRQLARAHAVGSVPGRDTCSPRAEETRVMDPGRLPQGQTAKRGRAPNPGRPPATARRCLPGQPAANLAAARAQQGTQAKGTVLGPHSHALAPTARGQRYAAACPKDWRPGEVDRLTPDPHHEGTRRRPRGMDPCQPYSAQRPTPARKSARRAPTPAPPCARETPRDGPQPPVPMTDSREVPPGATCCRPRGAHRPAGQAV